MISNEDEFWKEYEIIKSKLDGLKNKWRLRDMVKNPQHYITELEVILREGETIGVFKAGYTQEKMDYIKDTLTDLAGHPAKMIMFLKRNKDKYKY